MLTKEQILEVVKLKNDGLKERKIAEKFKVSTPTISNIILGLRN